MESIFTATFESDYFVCCFFGLLYILNIIFGKDAYADIFNGICFGFVIFAFLYFIIYTPLKIAKLRKVSKIDYNVIKKLSIYSLISWVIGLWHFSNPIIENIFFTFKNVAYVFYITALILSLTYKESLKEK